MDTDSIRELVMARAGKWRELARITGIDYGWISKFARGRVSEPMGRVQELADYFVRSRRKRP